MKTLLKRLKKRFRGSAMEVLPSLDAYALWAKNYPAHAHNKLMEIEQNSMLSLMPSLANKSVLDLACGSGRYAELATQYGAKQVLGIDNSLAMLHQSDITPLICGTTEAIPLANCTIDVILCGLALGHLPELNATMREISRLLKPNGVAVISDFHPFQFMSGARRTFQTDDVTYAVEHYVHQISDYYATATQHNLRLTAILEPVYQDVPVVLVLQFTKD